LLVTGCWLLVTGCWLLVAGWSSKPGNIPFSFIFYSSPVGLR
jgi:hypothetical protein